MYDTDKVWRRYHRNPAINGLDRDTGEGGIPGTEHWSVAVQGTDQLGTGHGFVGGEDDLEPTAFEDSDNKQQSSVVAVDDLPRRRASDFEGRRGECVCSH